MYYSFVTVILQWFMTKTTINGLLNRGHMFLFSKSHLSSVLDTSWENNNCGFNKSVMDLGAGDGEITQNLAHYFSNVVATEASPTMRWRLKEKGFRVHSNLTDWQEPQNLPPNGYDLISALNLLDRCPRPLKVLEQIRIAAINSSNQNKTCRILLGVVLPWSQYVEFEQKKANDPAPVEYISVQGKTFEQQLESFNETILKPQGFKLIRWTRVPYLCEGDTARSHYVLNNALLLLEPTYVD